MIERDTKLQITDETAIAYSTCYRLAGFSAQKLNRRTKEKSIKRGLLKMLLQTLSNRFSFKKEK